jgi:hypothetical protein
MPNIIADIAGQYNTFLELLKKMPDDEVISLGDMVDRGPDSKKVIEWFMKNGKAVFANHEHMMLDACRYGSKYYGPDIWTWNGGGATLDSFERGVPNEVLDWVEKLPLYMEIDDCLISHSFVYPGYNLIDACDLGTSSLSEKCDTNIMWNRCHPQRIEKYKMQICGHNSQFGLRRWADEKGEFAICLDDSRRKVLTGMHLPSFQIFQQEYIL